MDMVRKALACAALTLTAGTANAATIVKTYAFQASDFQNIGSGGAVSPYQTVTGSFTVTFDTALDAQNQTASIVVNNLSIAYQPQLSYDYIKSIDLLRIGADNDASTISSLTHDFALTIGSASATSHGAPFTNFLFTNATANDFFQAGSVRVTEGALPGVPEPATWALMLSGFGLAGMAVRRRPSVMALA